jgi:hypothetical protein
MKVGCVCERVCHPPILRRLPHDEPPLWERTQVRLGLLTRHPQLDLRQRRHLSPMVTPVASGGRVAGGSVTPKNERQDNYLNTWSKVPLQPSLVHSC